MLELQLAILDQRVALHTDDPEIAAVLRSVFGAFATDAGGRADLSVLADRRSGSFRVRTHCGTDVDCESLSDLVHIVDKDLMVEVQRRRPDLLFVHAAVLRHGANAVVLAGDSGSGKSTIAWGLVRAGFGFLSDELAPIDPRTCTVEAYPRALGLKRVPPGMELSDSALHLEHTVHVPVAELGTVPAPTRLPLSAIFFVQHDPAASAPRIAAVSAAESAARLYVLCLNALAHPSAGLDAVVSIAESVRGYELATAGIRETCTQLRSLVGDS